MFPGRLWAKATSAYRPSRCSIICRRRWQPLEPEFAVFQKVWGNRPNPPTITFMYVVGVAPPDFLVEIDAIAVVPL